MARRRISRGRNRRVRLTYSENDRSGCSVRGVAGLFLPEDRKPQGGVVLDPFPLYLSFALHLAV